MTKSNYILLLGAGFSRNWGGWLASEVFEYLLGCPEVNKDFLWKYKKRGGFEAALSKLQEEDAKSASTTLEPNLINFLSALRRMFNEMNQTFAKIQFEFQDTIQYGVAKFLSRFDAIFTLNQDLLVEGHYFNNVHLLSERRWDGPQLAGMKAVGTHNNPLESLYLGEFEPDPENFRISNRHQPYFKLHGSSNWIDSNLNNLLVMGGNKRIIIERYPVLEWIHEQFSEALTKPDMNLMIIGYSFGDDHINTVIREAVKKGNVNIFVIDPLGVDVMDKNRNALIHDADQLAKDLWPHLVGSSRRSLRDTFGNDHVEHAKIMRFFD